MNCGPAGLMNGSSLDGGCALHRWDLNIWVTSVELMVRAIRVGILTKGNKCKWRTDSAKSGGLCLHSTCPLGSERVLAKEARDC